MKKQFDGIELLRKFRDKEIDENTKIKSISMTGNEYYMHIGIGVDKILYESNEPVSTGYLTNKGNTFEIIEDKEIEDKEIEKLDESIYHDESALIDDSAHKINELIDEVNKLKEVKHE